MTGFSYKNNNGSYELTVGQKYGEDDEAMREFAVEYWETPKPLTLHLNEGVDNNTVAKALIAWLILAGVEKYLPKDRHGGEVDGKYVADTYQRIHVEAFRAVESTKK